MPGAEANRQGSWRVGPGSSREAVFQTCPKGQLTESLPTGHTCEDQLAWV